MDEFFEYLDILEDGVNRQRINKRYIRDHENPVEFYNNEEFRKRYRFLKNTVINIILPMIIEDLQKYDNRGLPIPPLIQLLLCLRFYATCNFQVVAGDLRGISQATVSNTIKRVSSLLAGKVHQFIRFPLDAHGHRQNITLFNSIAGFPGVSGCIDCTHIKITTPGGDNGEVFRNRKGYFSLNVQVVSGPRREILDIVVRYPGSSHDSVIFERSALRVQLERRLIPGLLLGDNGYACRHYLLTPFIQPNNRMLKQESFVDNPPEARYNNAHKRTRNIVERLFGIWKRQFPCLQKGLQTKLETSVAIICATAVLYNIGILHNDNITEDIVHDDEVAVDIIPNRAGRGLEFRRQFVIQHFNI